MKALRAMSTTPRMRMRPGVLVAGVLTVVFLALLCLFEVATLLAISRNFFVGADPRTPFATLTTGVAIPIAPGRPGFVIPRQIHQLWRSADTRSYPHNVSSAAWKQRYGSKGWKYSLWTDRDVEVLLARHYLWLLPQYRAYRHAIQRADLARLAILHRHGGVYVDLDGFPAPHAHLDSYPELLSYDMVLSRTTDRALVSNHFLMARPGSAFLAYCLHHSHRTVSRSLLLRYVLRYLDVFYGTGPLFMAVMLKEYTTVADAITSVDGDGGSSADGKTGVRENIMLLKPENTNAFVNHRSGRSWMAPHEKAVNWLVDRVGCAAAAVVVLLLAAAGCAGCCCCCVATARLCGGDKKVPSRRSVALTA